MTEKDSSQSSAVSSGMLKMKELSEITGAPKSTILLYVREGLLPKPVKTSPNMAYYDPACVDRIAFIKKVQITHRLPLAAIKGLLNEMDRGRDIAPLLELQSTVFGGTSSSLSRKRFMKASGLSAGELSTLCGLKLILPLEDGKFDDQDLDLAKQLKACMEKGLHPDDLSFYPDLAQKIVENEIRLREKHTRNLTFRENAVLTLELTRMARGLRAYVIDRTLQKELIRFKGLKKDKEA